MKCQGSGGVSMPMSSVIKGCARGGVRILGVLELSPRYNVLPAGIEEATFIAGEKNALSRDDRSVCGIADCGSRGRADGGAVRRKAGDELHHDRCRDLGKR